MNSAPQKARESSATTQTQKSRLSLRRSRANCSRLPTIQKATTQSRRFVFIHRNRRLVSSTSPELRSATGPAIAGATLKFSNIEARIGLYDDIDIGVMEYGSICSATFAGDFVYDLLCEHGRVIKVHFHDPRSSLDLLEHLRHVAKREPSLTTTSIQEPRSVNRVASGKRNRR